MRIQKKYSALNLIFVILAVVTMSFAFINCSGDGASFTGQDVSDQSNSGSPTTIGFAGGVFAGNIGGYGNLDGMGPSASFSSPPAIAVDSAGSFYVADYNNNTIRKITPSGVVTTFAGTAGVHGSADGTGASASFYLPGGIAVDASGTLYVADTGNSTIRKITPSGVVTTLAGTAGVHGSTDGTGTSASFYYPYGVTLDTGGNVYVADSSNNTIRKITPAGVVSTLAGTAGVAGSADGDGASASFHSPMSIMLDPSGFLFVVDCDNNTIRKITVSGVVTTFAGTAGLQGSADGPIASATFSTPTTLSRDSSGNLFVADTGNNTIRKISPAGIVTTFAGTAGVRGSADGTGASASFRAPRGGAVDFAGNVFVADYGNNTIRKITPGGVVTTFAGTPFIQGSADGTGASAGFSHPRGMAVDASGNIYVADYNNDIIRKITPAGVVTTLAGTAGVIGSADGAGASASFYGPWDVAVDSSGYVYVADTGNATIRKITPGGVVTTLAGTEGMRGVADGIGANAQFDNPSGISLDSSGNIFVADTTSQTIRKITQSGVVTTFAGTAGVVGSADGVGASASFNYPRRVAVDASGNVYIVDTNSNTIRRITSAGVVTTFAGTAGVKGSSDGTGAQASFNNPMGITLDSSGDVYVADSDNFLIRKITPSGVVTTVVGKPGQIGVQLTTLPGAIALPMGLAIFGRTLYATMNNGLVFVSKVP